MKTKKPLKSKTRLKQGNGFNNRKSPRQRAISRADKLIQQVAVILNDGICQFPGCKAPSSEGHHVVHRDNYALRWVAANVPGLCHEHHEWDKDATKKSKLLKGIIKRMGGQANYEALVLYGNTHLGEHPRDAIDRLQKVLDKYERDVV